MLYGRNPSFVLANRSLQDMSLLGVFVKLEAYAQFHLRDERPGRVSRSSRLTWVGKSGRRPRRQQGERARPPGRRPLRRPERLHRSRCSQPQRPAWRRRRPRLALSEASSAALGAGVARRGRRRRIRLKLKRLRRSQCSWAQRLAQRRRCPTGVVTGVIRSSGCWGSTRPGRQLCRHWAGLSLRSKWLILRLLVPLCRPHDCTAGGAEGVGDSGGGSAGGDQRLHLQLLSAGAARCSPAVYLRQVEVRRVLGCGDSALELVSAGQQSMK